MRSLHRITQKGFTIIETLVAVTLLMIAIAGPLLIASKGLTSALYAKDQMTASYLAQEAMETIKNQKSNLDYNDLLGSKFDTFISKLNTSCGDQYHRCDFDTITPGNFTNCGPSGALCPLFVSDKNIYSTNDSGNKTVFKRGFYLEKATAVLPPGSPTLSVPSCSYADDQECRIHVTVSWNTTTIENEIDLYLNVTQQTNK